MATDWQRNRPSIPTFACLTIGYASRELLTNLAGGSRGQETVGMCTPRTDPHVERNLLALREREARRESPIGICRRPSVDSRFAALDCSNVTSDSRYVGIIAERARMTTHIAESGA